MPSQISFSLLLRYVWRKISEPRDHKFAGPCRSTNYILSMPSKCSFILLPEGLEVSHAGDRLPSAAGLHQDLDGLQLSLVDPHRVLPGELHAVPFGHPRLQPRDEPVPLELRHVVLSLEVGVVNGRVRFMSRVTS